MSALTVNYGAFLPEPRLLYRVYLVISAGALIYVAAATSRKRKPRNEIILRAHAANLSSFSVCGGCIVPREARDRPVPCDRSRSTYSPINALINAESSFLHWASREIG